ncbi:MAG: carbohydrate ABC transporter permease [Actinomycetota bacterium]|nr:carbohydrate ABC transporter permease [Actinomycetota bacterium]
MTAVATATIAPTVKDETPLATKITKKSTSPFGRAVVWLVAALWTVPTFGLFISSLRPEAKIKTTGWWTWFTDWEVTSKNYSGVLEYTGGSGRAFSSYFWNSLAITIPGSIIPIVVAAFAAYALSWMSFWGRDKLFVLIVALMVVPLQMCLIPLLRFFKDYTPLSGGVPQIWMAHTIFAMPLAIFLLRNFIGSLPSEVIEAARVDGASHMTIFARIVMPLSVPAIASIAIFQFLWVWNDLLVAKVFGGGSQNAPMTAALVDMVGTKGSEWQLLTAGAFVSMVVPLAVFIGLQRYFVRGLLAGSVKG